VPRSQRKPIHYTLTSGSGDKKYVLTKLYSHATGITGCRFRMGTESGAELSMTANGLMVAHAGVTWDGPSGPAVDTVSFMRASFVHDMLYLAIREGYVGKKYRKVADKLLRQIAREDGMPLFRAWYAWAGVRLAGWQYV